MSPDTDIQQTCTALRYKTALLATQECRTVLRTGFDPLDGERDKLHILHPLQRQTCSKYSQVYLIKVCVTGSGVIKFMKIL